MPGSNRFLQPRFSLFCTWVGARQTAEADAAETVGRLLWWMEHHDYGFCHRLERDVVKVLDADGLTGLAAKARARLEIRWK